LSLWYDAVARIRVQLMYWMDKQSKHVAVSWWNKTSYILSICICMNSIYQLYLLVWLLLFSSEGPENVHIVTILLLE
jgi:hypothetical protein